MHINQIGNDKTLGQISKTFSLLTVRCIQQLRPVHFDRKNYAKVERNRSRIARKRTTESCNNKHASYRYTNKSNKLFLI